ncbi:ammonium transporter [Antrihabitans stalactiti]|uniref:Ammonium transporter n=1 Tax=Antrihabitans stalactiti TaxID=2584121 RepID=A0A848KQB4_9NOCA|nr:ammonium transporter [Antrihabitans stalactiti]NMN99114.1 ammonium transporter [Antrihabitans stalactiti]
MNTRKITVAAVFVIAAMGLGAGTSYADPAVKDVSYETKLVDKSVVTTLDAGMFSINADGKTFDIKDGAGQVLVTMPLAYTAGPLEFPIAHEVSADNRTLKLTPSTDVLSARPALVKPVASVIEDNRARAEFATQLGIATAIGGLIGTGIGAVAGGILGAAGILGGPAVLLTVLTGIASGAAVGGIAGTIVAGGPTLIAAGIDLVSTLIAPPGTTRFNYVEPR